MGDFCPSNWKGKTGIDWVRMSSLQVFRQFKMLLQEQNTLSVICLLEINGNWALADLKGTTVTKEGGSHKNQRKSNKRMILGR